MTLFHLDFDSMGEVFHSLIIALCRIKLHFKRKLLLYKSWRRSVMQIMFVTVTPLVKWQPLILEESVKSVCK